MSANQPLWLRTVHKLERTIGGPVESVVRSDTYFDTMSRLSKTRRAAIDVVEGLSRRGLHLFNLPAGTDVRRMREQLSRLERRLDQLSYDVRDLDEDGRPPPRSRVE